MLTIAWAVLVLYGSLLPFDHRLPTGVSSVTAFIAWLPTLLTAPVWDARFAAWNVLAGHSTEARSDLWLNLILYFPLGLLVRLHDRSLVRNQLHWWLRGLLAILTIIWVMECMQSLAPDRCAYLTDVLHNCIGALLGMLLAAPLVLTLKRSLFWAYCQAAYPTHRLRQWLARERRLPGVIIVLAAANLVLLAWWLQTGGTGGTGGGSSKPGAGTNWLPFWHQFQHTYVRTSEYVFRTLIVYSLVTLLLLVQFLSVHRKRGFGTVLLLVFMLALLLQSGRQTYSQTRFDITEPLLALSSVALVILGVLALVRSIQCHCRRKSSVPVTLDRRRIKHAY